MNPPWSRIPGIPVLNLAPPFIPPGDSTSEKTEDLTAFVEIVSLAESEALRKRESELKAKIRTTRKSILADVSDFPEVAKRVKAKLATNQKKSLPGSADRRFEARDHSCKANEYFLEGIQNGDAEAIELLYETALDTAMLLKVAIKTHPEIARGIGRKSWGLPVIATKERRWIDRIRNEMAEVELGENHDQFRCRFRDANGADENNPARLWAKEAVRTLEETYRRVVWFSHHGRELCALAESERIHWMDDLEWISTMPKYRPFSRDTLEQWSKPVRALIKESVPDLHLRPEWENVRTSLRARASDTPGRIRGAILDDIDSALRTVAPLSPLPESAS